MLKCASVYTNEIDDLDVAFSEIKSQLDEKIELLTHSVGIIACNPEFISSGALEHICENLPFDVVGTTSAAQAVNGESSEMILTMFVITSDDVWFKTGVTGSLDESISAPIKAAIGEATSGVSEQPGLALIFPPLILKYSGDSYVDAVQENLPDVPIFGSLPVDDTLTYELSETVCNGDTFRTAMSFVLCYGNINPGFIVGTFPEDKVMPYKGEITKSNGSLVSEINGLNAYEYFDSIGFINNGVLAESFSLVPFALHQKKRSDYDGVPVIRGIALFTEDGTAVFRGDVDEGSTFSLLTCEADDVLSATRQGIEQVNSLPEINGALLYPCIARRMMTMRLNPLMELDVVREAINPDIPFMMSYAGGEISPTLISNGIPTNRYHNYSLVILVI